MKFTNRLMDIFMSRKFLALAIATVLIWFGKITEYAWVVVVVAYIGANLADSVIKKKNTLGVNDDKSNL